MCATSRATSRTPPVKERPEQPSRTHGSILLEDTDPLSYGELYAPAVWKALSFENVDLLQRDRPWMRPADDSETPGLALHR